MPETCLTCLTTQNLVHLKEQEWTALDLLLPTVIAKYPDLRSNTLTRVCLSCRYSLKFIVKFRLSAIDAINDFVYLMTVWNIPQSTVSAPKDPLSCDDMVAPPTPSSDTYTSRKKQDQIMPSLTQILHRIKKAKSEKDTGKTVPVPEVADKSEEILAKEIKSENLNDFHQDNEIVNGEIEYLEETELVSEGNITDEEYLSSRDDEKSDSEQITTLKPTASPTTCPKQNSCENSVKNREDNINNNQLSIPIIRGKYKTSSVRCACQVCKKTLSSKHSLKSHMEAKHEDKKHYCYVKKHYCDDKKHYCDVCKKLFSWTSYKSHFNNSLNHSDKKDRKLSSSSP